MYFVFAAAALVACSASDKNSVGSRMDVEEKEMARATVPGEAQFILTGELSGEGRVSLAVLPYGETTPTVSYAGGDYVPVKLVLDGTFAGALWYTTDTGSSGRWNREGAVLPSGWESWSSTDEMNSQSLGIIAPVTVTSSIEIWDMGG